jgi:hypothetical protein
MTTTAKNTKKTSVVAAIVPVVCSAKKQVFLKVVKANGDRSCEATVNAVKAGKIDHFEGEGKTFVKEVGIANVHVWNSRVAKVQPKNLVKAQEKQAAFWKRVGFTVVNE